MSEEQYLVMEVFEDSEQSELEDERDNASNTATVDSSDQHNLESETEEENQPKRCKVEEDKDDDGKLCLICLDNWTNMGEHRICALKCGHLFGHHCIMRWISSNKTCPTCKVKASKSDIRFIYANRLIAIDTAELEVVKNQLVIVQEERNRAQLDLTTAICKEHLLMQEIEKMKSRVAPSHSSQPSKAIRDNMRLLETYQVCPQGSCRVMDAHPRSGKFVVSLKSPNNLFQGFGVKKYNMHNFLAIDYTPLHTKAIRDVKFNHTNNLLLSVSLDKNAKILDFEHKQTVATVNSASMLWSCCWEYSNPFIFYIGEQQGAVRKYDLRNTNEAVESFEIAGDLSPVVSLVSVPSAACSAMPLGGFVACKLNSVWAYDCGNSNEYKQQNMRMLGPFTSMAYDTNDQQFLITTRPNARDTSMRHMVCTMARSFDSSLEMKTLYSFSGGQMQKQMSRTCFLQNPKNLNTFIAAQQDNTISVWSINNGDLSYKLRNNSSVIDLMHFNRDDDGFLLALSEKRLDIYKFCDV